MGNFNRNSYRYKKKYENKSNSIVGGTHFFTESWNPFFDRPPDSQRSIFNDKCSNWERDGTIVYNGIQPPALPVNNPGFSFIHNGSQPSALPVNNPGFSFFAEEARPARRGRRDTPRPQFQMDQTVWRRGRNRWHRGTIVVAPTFNDFTQSFTYNFRYDQQPFGWLTPYEYGVAEDDLQA